MNILRMSVIMFVLYAGRVTALSSEKTCELKIGAPISTVQCDFMNDGTEIFNDPLGKKVKAYLILCNDIAFNVQTIAGNIVYISTDTPTFKTPEGLSRNSTLGDVLHIKGGNFGHAFFQGGALVIPLPSGWSAIFQTSHFYEKLFLDDLSLKIHMFDKMETVTKTKKLSNNSGK